MPSSESADPGSEPKRAFILRMSHGRDRVAEALDRNEIVVGWANAAGLLATTEWGPFRQIVHEAYHRGDGDYRRSGAAAGHAWRFVVDMVSGSLVVVPSNSDFLVAEVTGPAQFDADRILDDSAYSRKVRWLNGGRAIPRSTAHAPLQSRMKIQGTTANASDLIREIETCIGSAGAGDRPTFARDLRARLVRETLHEIRTGRIDPFGFEHLVAAVLSATGGTSVRIVPRMHDKGADVTAEFRVAGALTLRVAVQAKHYQPAPPVSAAVVDELARGMDAEGAHYGIVVTSGAFSPEALKKAEDLGRDGRRIELMDGEQFAALIVDCGLSTVRINP